MKKNNFVKFFGVLAILSVFTSCEDDDVTPIVNLNKPTMTITPSVANGAIVAEGQTVSFTLNLSEPVGQAFTFFVVLDQQGSTADDADSNINGGLGNTTFQRAYTVPPFVTSFTGEIVIAEDILAEDLETLKLSIGDTRTSAVVFEPVPLTIQIQSVVEDGLNLTFHFDKTYGNETYTNTLCETHGALTDTSYDIDFLVYDEFGNDMGVLDAQTGSCTEALSMSLDDFVDGRYDITAFLYTTGDLEFSSIGFPLTGIADFAIPITVDYSRPGAMNGVYTQESAYNLMASDVANTEKYVVSVLISTIDGVRKFSIVDSASNVIATGKVAPHTPKRKLKV